jgi:hypothetical protein
MSTRAKIASGALLLAAARDAARIALQAALLTTAKRHAPECFDGSLAHAAVLASMYDELRDAVDAALDAGDLHQARRLNEELRLLELAQAVPAQAPRPG